MSVAAAVRPCNRISPPPPHPQPNSLRLAIVSDALPQRNGVGTYYQDLMEQLRDRLESAVLISPTGTSVERHEWFDFPLPGDPTQRLVWPRIHTLYQRLKNLRPDIIIVPTLGPYGLTAMRFARRNRIPVCLAHHTNFDALAGMYWNSLAGRCFRTAMRFIHRRATQQAQVVIGMNDETVNTAMQFGARRVCKMGTPLATDFLRSPTHPISSQPRRVIFVGRLAAEKGVEQVIQSATQLSDFEFRIAGDGPQRSVIEAAVQRLPNVKLLGWLNRQQVREAIDQSDILVLPSKQETFGTVALEGLARERVVITSGECGIVNWPELSAGLFVMNHNERLNETLLRLRDAPSWKIRSMVHQGTRSAIEFNEQTIQRWVTTLMDVAERS